jgi:hypothetical protein
MTIQRLGDDSMHFDILSSLANLVGSSSPLRRGEFYLDPGSGSFLIQLLIAALLGGAFVIRSYWGKILDFFRRLFKKDARIAQDDE